MILYSWHQECSAFMMISSLPPCKEYMGPIETGSSSMWGKLQWPVQGISGDTICSAQCRIVYDIQYASHYGLWVGLIDLIDMLHSFFCLHNIALYFKNRLVSIQMFTQLWLIFLLHLCAHRSCLHTVIVLELAHDVPSLVNCGQLSHPTASDEISPAWLFQGTLYGELTGKKVVFMIPTLWMPWPKMLFSWW